MIAQVRGLLAQKSAAGLVVEVGGVGLSVAVPLSTFERLPDEGREVFLFTYLNIVMRTDSIALYGFGTREERDLFLALIGVSGVGARIALACLSGARVGDLRVWIAEGHTSLLTRIPGVGRKTAERIVVELRERIAEGLGREVAPGAPVAGPAQEAVLALEALGMKEAREKVAAVVAGEKGREMTPEEIVRAALGHGGRGQGSGR